MSVDKKQLTQLVKCLDEKDLRLHQAVLIGARLANDPALLNDCVADRPNGMFLYDDKMSRTTSVPPSSIAPMMMPAQPSTPLDIAETMADMAKNIPTNGLIVDVDAVAQLAEKFGPVERNLLEGLLRKQVISTSDDGFGRVAEMMAHTKPIPAGAPQGTKPQTVQVPVVEPVEGDWTISEIVARMLPLVPTTASHFNYSSIGTPAVNISTANAPINVSHETVLIAKTALGIDLLDLPATGSEDAIAMYNAKVAHVVVGVARKGQRKVVPVVEDGKVTGFTSTAASTKNQSVSLSPFIKVGFRGIKHFDESTDPLDANLLVAPAPWFLRDLAAIAQCLVGREHLTPEYTRFLELDSAGRKDDFNMKAIVDSLNARTYSGLVDRDLFNDEIKEKLKKATTPAEVREHMAGIIKLVVKAGWMPTAVRARTVNTSLIPNGDALEPDALAERMSNRNVPLAVAAKNAAPLWFNSLLRFGCVDLDEKKMSGSELLAATKPLRPIILGLAKIACGKEILYPVAVLDEDAAAASAAKKKPVRKPKVVPPPPPPPVHELTKALGDLKRSHDDLVAEVADLKTLVGTQARKLRKVVRAELGRAVGAPVAPAARPAPHQFAANVVATMEVDDDDVDEDVEDGEEDDTSDESDVASDDDADDDAADDDSDDEQVD